MITPSIILSALLTVLGLLMIVFGWFMVKVFANVTDSVTRLNDQIYKLSGTISGMNAIQLTYQGGIDDMKGGCVNRHKDVREKLEDHSNKISEHDGDIKVLKSKIK